MSKLCEGRVAIVTGAGRGIGREHALSLARHGAKVVVNDLGGNMDGTGADASPAQQVVDEIKGMGGEAVANGDNVASWDGAEAMIRQAIDTFGDLHVVVNNAGILRDRVLANMTEAEWDAVIAVHLKGTFAPSRHAAAYWREQAKAGKPVSGRIINTTSVSGIYGNPGQTNYGAAKAGIAAFTNIAAMELAALRRHGQRRRPGRPHPHDRGPRHRRRRPTRSARPAPRTGSPRSSRGSPRRSPPASPAASSRRRARCSPSPRAGSAARRSPRSTTRRRSATPSPSCSPRPGRTAAWTASPVRGRRRSRLQRRAHRSAEPACRLNPDAVGATSEPAEFSWTSKDALLYAVSIGAGEDELAFTTENTAGVDQVVFPTFPVVMGYGAGPRRDVGHRVVQPGDARARPAGRHAAPADPAVRARRR